MTYDEIVKQAREAIDNAIRCPVRLDPDQAAEDFRAALLRQPGIVAVRNVRVDTTTGTASAEIDYMPQTVADQIVIEFVWDALS